MNTSMIRFILGQVLKLEALLLLLPCIVALCYQETVGVYFVISALLCGAAGFLLSGKKPQNTMFYLKEGCIATALSWILLSIFGCLPFFLSGEIPSFTDALFETVSGFTTTGASILSDVEALSHCMLFWRSFTNWIGGMGVLVFLLAIIPLSGSHFNLMRAESPGPSVGKLVPKLRYTARILYLIYFALTAGMFLFLLFGGMPVFDSLTTAIATAGTGGFAIRNDSMTSYSTYSQWVITIFMLLFGINFNAYYLLLFGEVRKALCMEEVRWYLIVAALSTAIICLNIFNTCTNAFDALTQSAFQVATIMTTCGFSSVDFDLWPEVSKTLLVILMFIGACAGSTSGGIKVSRFVVVTKTLKKELNSYIHPKSVKKIKMDDKVVDHEVIRSINVYFITFLVVFTCSLFLISFENWDFSTNFTAVAATINNIGPGLSLVGPTKNFGLFTNFSKYVLMFDMLAGRLELFPLLILFHPAMWKDLGNSVKEKLKRTR